MERLKPPKALEFDENISNHWKTWKKHLEFYLAATESDGKEDKVKTSILLTCIGDQGRRIYDTFDFKSNENPFNYAVVLKKFDEYWRPRKNITITRHKFFTYRQNEGQLFNDFLTNLKKLADECEFQHLRDSLIKDLIVCGVFDESLRERMLRDNDLDLEKATKLAYASEQTKSQLKSIQSNNISTVKRSDTILKCKFCSGSHRRGNCPAYGKTCLNCNKKNHFAKCCFSKIKLKEIKYDNDSSEDENNFTINSVKVANVETEEKYIDEKIDFVSENI